jgi:hypothetical protein
MLLIDSGTSLASAALFVRSRETVMFLAKGGMDDRGTFAWVELLNVFRHLRKAWGSRRVDL